ncbi:hypothetical protein PCANC_03403 [Puccinia coronata f. sp. avenae]|uniref:Uncharacterized protein n=1 Tax=Puccinia coronata f. sp. avenae TaxID=200324 RepID=A0A2N5S5I2_9BASI|nr:hypothetical protein PCANC_28019 [Puccinia coronata f. sp. avenae]PLW08485.1 hypothetical protein PCANC_22031 [Puccinia coronata f. sp. avenae]PLW56364.1 hypothetical protein PCANC_03403 [Puccinia coronata f. sp. avenae]
MAISDINSDAAIRASFAGSAPGNLVTSLATAAACAQAGIWPGRNQRLGLAVVAELLASRAERARRAQRPRGTLSAGELNTSPSNWRAW